jgi:multiple antibiotic resistance protein
VRAVKFFGEVFVTLLVITDPAGTVPLFIALTRGREPRERPRRDRRDHAIRPADP